MERKVIPIGIDSFRKLRERGYYYVDKTGFAKRLIRTEKHCFLSRPRLFGKSTFVSMLKELFEGNKRLFEGLAIYDDWDWATSHPVIRLNLHGGCFLKRKHLERHIINQIEEVEKNYGTEPPDEDSDAGERLSWLIYSLYETTGKRVVLLVDGYDKPVLYNLDLPKLARKNLDYLYGFYSVLKSHDDEIKFSFFTGVNKLSFREEFMGPDNLCDITVDPNYSAMCGFTEADLDNVFAPELEGIDRARTQEWYKGYSWQGEEKVYNPWDILNLLERRKFEPWWIEFDSQGLITKTLNRKKVMPIELGGMNLQIRWHDLLDINDIALEVLLFQTGYLTIAEVKRVADSTVYKLDYPNREVRQCLNGILLDAIHPGISWEHICPINHLQNMLSACDVEGMKSMFQLTIPHILWRWHTSEDIANCEAFVASAFYTYFMSENLDVRAVDFTNRGRIDLALTGPSYVYLFEFRMVGKTPSGKALKQMKEKDYAQKYRDLGKPVYHAGVEFSIENRNIICFEVIPDNGEGPQDVRPTSLAATADLSL